MAEATSTLSSSRSMWTLFEPIHAVTYFAPEARSAYERAGLRGFWRGYFAGRAAPLGPAGAAVVAASFFNFAPAFVARAIPGVWELITPEEALRVRLAGATEALGRLLPGRESAAGAAAGLLWRAVGELDFSGRVLPYPSPIGVPAPGGVSRLPPAPARPGHPGRQGMRRSWCSRANWNSSAVRSFSRTGTTRLQWSPTGQRWIRATTRSTSLSLMPGIQMVVNRCP